MLTRPRRKRRLRLIRFGHGARSVLKTGIAEAGRRSHRSVQPLHILWGLTEHSPELFGADLEQILDDLEYELERLEVVEPRPDTVPYSDLSRRVLAASREVASRRDQDGVGPSELLEAIRQTPDEPTRRMLRHGLDHATKSARQGSPLPEGDLGWLAVVDDSADPYPTQIFDAVSEAVASGELLPGERLPSVRRLAEQLELAPGTVAKAYKALEASSIVRTSRAHGTVVAVPKEPGVDGLSIEEVAALLRPGVVAAFHQGASMVQLSDALALAARPIYGPGSGPRS